MQPVEAKTLFGYLWPNAPENFPITAVVTDSRKVQPGCAFVAIKGERVDGHDYAAQALQSGARVVVLQHPVQGIAAEKTVLVHDPLDAMIALGANYRQLFQPLLLGVTGSVGKTTTKEFCAAVFSAFGATLKTEGNQNNEIGLPNTLFSLTDSTRYAVVEMGMQCLGEIHKLTLAARPAAAIITKIGTAHMQTLGSIQNVLKAKMEICDGLSQGAPLVLNGDDELLCQADIPAGIRAVYAGIQNETCDVRAQDIRMEGEGQRFLILDKQYGQFEAYIPAIGRHNVQNALLAYTAATRLGLNAEQTVVALSGYETAGMRQKIVHANGITIIEDCYNANPDSMRAALSALAELKTINRRIAVLGDMMELGEIAPEAHRQLGEECANSKVDTLITVGPLAALAVPQAQKLGVHAVSCNTNAQAAQQLIAEARRGDAVLVKASRVMQFEQILDAFRQNLDG